MALSGLGVLLMGVIALADKQVQKGGDRRRPRRGADRRRALARRRARRDRHVGGAVPPGSQSVRRTVTSLPAGRAGGVLGRPHDQDDAVPRRAAALLAAQAAEHRARATASVDRAGGQQARAHAPGESEPAHDRARRGRTRRSGARGRSFGEAPRRVAAAREHDDGRRLRLLREPHGRAHDEPVGPRARRPRGRVPRASPAYGQCASASAARTMRFIVSTTSAGWTPTAVSPESMTASEPSNTAFATSEASARVGRDAVVIDSSICVAVIATRPWRAAASRMRFWRPGHLLGPVLEARGRRARPSRRRTRRAPRRARRSPRAARAWRRAAAPAGRPRRAWRRRRFRSSGAAHERDARARRRPRRAPRGREREVERRQRRPAVHARRGRARPRGRAACRPPRRGTARRRAPVATHPQRRRRRRRSRTSAPRPQRREDARAGRAPRVRAASRGRATSQTVAPSREFDGPARGCVRRGS